MEQRSSRSQLNRRTFLKGAAVLLSGAALAACAPAAPQAGTGAEPDAEGGGPTTITIWGWPAADVAYASFSSDFEAAFPEIELDIQMMPTADEHNKLLTALAAGAGAPDVGMIEINHIDKFVVKGGLVNLADAPFDGAQYKEDMVAYKWEQGTAPDGRLVAFPWDIGPATFFYRRDILDEVGVPSSPEEVAELTRDWEGFLELCRMVTDPEAQRWAIGSASDIVYTNFAHRNFFDEDWNVIVNGELPVRLLGIAKQARAAGVDAKVSNWTPEWQTMLGTGSIVMQYGGCWFGGFLKGYLQPEDAEWEGKWGIFEVPEDPGQNWGGSFLCIPEQSTNKEAAWSFIEYALATKEAQNKMFLAVDYFPAYIPAFDDPLYEEADPFFGGQKTRAMWIDIALNKIKPFVTTPMDAQAEQLFFSYVAQALDQDLDPQATLDQAAAEIETQTEPDKEEALRMRG